MTMHYDGMTPAYLEALSVGRQSARTLARMMGQNTTRSNVAAVRAFLEQMERKGLVQRTKVHGTWIWEVTSRA